MRRTVDRVYDRLEGKIGMVTDAVPAGGELTGEVMIDGQAYYALPVDPAVPIPKGTRVVVVDHTLHRTVVVTPM
jgi:membrane protein implicated in regulation of membrane protease activity